MSSMDRFVRWLTGEEGQAVDASTTNRQAARQAVDNSGLPALDNNAEPYGVTVEPVSVAPGTRFWRAVRVHHLSPQENRGRHHIYIDATKADGSRAFNTQAHITWDGGEHTTMLDKPISEPAANFPMFKWQKCSVEMEGMPSDKVHGLSSSHPDEANPDGSQTGNTLFHHSFLVIFQEVTAPQAVTTGTIQGRVENSEENSGEGMIVELLQSGRVIASMQVAADGTFAFQTIEAGNYTLRVDNQTTPVQVQAGKTAAATLVLTTTQSVIEGTVHAGAGLLLRLVQAGEIRAEGPLGQSGAFRLRNLSAGLYHVQILRPGESEPIVKSDALEMDGTNRRTIELTVSASTPVPMPEPEVPLAASAKSGSPLEHYVLFSSSEPSTVKAQLTALFPRLAAKGLGFGFDYQEAARAKEVTVVGDDQLIPEFQVRYLASRGVKVRRLTGAPEQLSGQL